MSRRWCIPLTALALVFGSMLAAGSASAATTGCPSGRLAFHSRAASWSGPPGMLAGSQKVHVNQDESTNWSGYAATGANGAYHSVIASWIEPTGTCTSRRAAQYPASGSGWTATTATRSSRPARTSDCNGRTPEYYGWYEMYPANPVNFTNTSGPVTTSAPR